MKKKKRKKKEEEDDDDDDDDDEEISGLGVFRVVYFTYFESLAVYRSTGRAGSASKKAYNCHAQEF